MISDREIIEKLKIYMSGLRDNGITPAWQHPIDVLDVFEEMQKEVGFGIDINLTDEWEKEHKSDTIEIIRKSCLLHDIIEDGIKEDGTSFDCYDLAKLIGYSRGMQGSPLEGAINLVVEALTKESHMKFGTWGLVEYFHEKVYSSDLAVIVKCCDRVSNLREAVNTFKPYRLERYKWETKMFIIPLAKELECYPHWRDWLLDQLEELSYTEHQPRKENVKR